MVTNIPNVQNWTVTPQNGQPGYFTLMNTWLGQSTLVIASLQSAIVAQNTANNEINELAIQAENNAIIANGLANFQGAWSGSVPYLKGQSVSSSGLYYTSKVDNNLNHAVTNTDYWIYNPINDKVTNSGNETIDGIKTFTASPIVPTPTTTGNVITMDNIIQKTAAGIGYGNGSGGTVTQLTSKNTPVTLNKPCGTITASNSTLAPGSSVSFIVYNNLVATADLIYCYGGAYSSYYQILADNTTDENGRFNIRITNTSGITLSDSLLINFSIIKGARA